jgi:hypothetical protein
MTSVCGSSLAGLVLAWRPYTGVVGGRSRCRPPDFVDVLSGLCLFCVVTLAAIGSAEIVPLIAATAVVVEAIERATRTSARPRDAGAAGYLGCNPDGRVWSAIVLQALVERKPVGRRLPQIGRHWSSLSARGWLLVQQSVLFPNGCSCRDLEGWERRRGDRTSVLTTSGSYMCRHRTGMAWHGMAWHGMASQASGAEGASLLFARLEIGAVWPTVLAPSVRVCGGEGSSLLGEC